MPNLSHQHRIVSSLRDFLRGVRHGHAALEEQLVDVAQAQLEAEIPTHCATDDASRKTVPRKILTDQLRSYPAAKAEIPELASVKHVFVKAAARLNNRAENSHRPTRERERRMRGFRDPKRTQKFLSCFGPTTFRAQAASAARFTLSHTTCNPLRCLARIHRMRPKSVDCALIGRHLGVVPSNSR